MSSQYPVKIPGMPKSREETARRLFDAFNRRDLQAGLDLVHPEIVFQPVSGAVMAAGEPYCGHEGIRRYFSDVDTYWQSLTVHPVHLRAAGQAVVALGRVDGRGSAGVLEGVATTWVLKFKDGLVIHAQVFSDERLAREALGAQE
jgi:ketosteroid isomerase-like protein